MSEIIMEEKLRGIFSPISTPFYEDGSVNYEGLISNIQYYYENGLKGFLALGSNGENKSLSVEEKFKVLKTIIDNKGPGQVIMSGCIFESTAETIEMAREMEKYHPDYITLLPPSYFKKQMNDDALYKFFTDVADSVNTPCLLYNAPQFSAGITLSVSLIKRCAKHENIVGMKDSSSGNMENFLQAVRDEFTVVSGTIGNFLTCMLLGGSGGVLSFANTFPKRCVEMYNLFANKDYEKAIEYYDKLSVFSKALGGANGIAGVKYAMDLLGLVGGVPRLPLMPLSDEAKDRIKDRLKEEGCLE